MKKGFIIGKGKGKYDINDPINPTNILITHPGKLWVDKIDLTGADVISNITVDEDGNPTGWVIRALTPADIGASATGHTHNYLPLTGGTVTGLVTIDTASGNIVEFKSAGVLRSLISSDGGQQWMVQDSTAVERGKIIYTTPGGKVGIIFFDAAGNSRTQIVHEPGGGLSFGGHSASTSPTNNIYFKPDGQILSKSVRIEGTGGTTGDLQLVGTNPTIRFEDTDQTGAGKYYWIHQNAGRLYFLRDNSGDGTWDAPHSYIETDGQWYILGYKVWHAGNFDPASKENAFTKNTAFNKSFGTVAGTVAEGNHTHNYDNYGSWLLKMNSDAGTSVTSGGAVNLIAGTNVTLSRTGNDITIAASGGGSTYTAGTGIAIDASNVISNTAPDQTVALTGGGATTITGTYPNFTISSTDTNTWRPIHDAPTDGATTTSISSNWAFDITGVINGKEPAFTKNTAFNKNFGGTGTATTVSRSDHTHSDPTADITASTTLAAADSGKTFICSGSITITVPTGLGTNFSCNFINNGTTSSVVTIAAGTGTSFVAPHGTKLLYGYSCNVTKRTGAETFYLQGELSV